MSNIPLQQQSKQQRQPKIKRRRKGGLLDYTLKRLGQSLFTIFIVMTAVFLLMRLLPVEGYFGPELDNMSEIEIEVALRNMGLLDPWYQQLFNFYSDLVQGDLGTSIKYRTNIPVANIIIEKIPISFWFGAVAVVISLIIGLSVGTVAAREKGRWPDVLVQAYIVFINAVPAVVYLLLIQLYITDLFNLPMLFNVRNPVTWVLPALCMALGGIARYSMWIRRFMVDELNKDYIKLARAKGLPNRIVMTKHIFRNAFIPLSQNLPQTLLLTIAGSLYIESLYSIPGTGGLVIDAIGLQDNPLVQALVLMYTAIGVFGLFAGDILMAIVDPRIKLAGKGDAR